MCLPITPEDIAALSLDERVVLAEVIWESIEAEPEPVELTEEFRRELERRSAAHDAAPGDAVPWEVVKERALSRLRR